MNVQNRGGISDETNFDLDIYYIKKFFYKNTKMHRQYISFQIF